jgi:hypothetical protein
MYLKKKPKYPVRKWLGKYSAYSATQKKTKKWEQEEACIERFLRCFPRYRSLEHFTATNFADFVVLYPKANVKPIRHFWNWLKKQGLPLYQVAINCYKPRVKTNYNLNLEDMLRLLEHCRTTVLKRKIINAVKGESSFIPSRCIGLRQELRNAATSAGMPVDFRLCQLKARVNSRVGQGIVENYCNQLLNALPVEA